MRKIVFILFYYALTIPAAYSQQTCKFSTIRTSTPDHRFIVNNDNTVIDIQTKLMWKKCTEGLSGTKCNSGIPGTFTWVQALEAAGLSSFSGYTNWRLPNIKELASITETACTRPAINLTIFPNTQSDGVRDATFYWSSTARQPPGGTTVMNLAWGINFYNGYDGYYNRLTRDQSHFVRLVRNN